MTALQPAPTLPSLPAWIDGCAIAIDHAGPIDRPFDPFHAADLSQPIAALFARVAARFASRTAIVDTVGASSYRDIAIRVERLAAR
ncbi:hypothetical protein OEZ83_26980, partial [Leclercia adecarboxylata]|uniref:hypothetical protein n=1 Tax=Leclercia adecarboxylata TaxID=83655 RepID=UPI00234CF1A1